MNCNFENCNNNATHKQNFIYDDEERIINFLCDRHGKLIENTINSDGQKVEIQIL